MCFYSDTARVDFATEVDWHEEKKLLKAYFPVDIRTDFATFDIQFGTIRRATHANTSWDAAKHEVFGHKWCDLSEARYGVALLNDSKYGYSVREGNMGLSLLKSSKFPDHQADMGHHSFVYSMLPHDKALEESTVFESKLQEHPWDRTNQIIRPQFQARVQSRQVSLIISSTFKIQRLGQKPPGSGCLLGRRDQVPKGHTLKSRDREGNICAHLDEGCMIVATSRDCPGHHNWNLARYYSKCL